MLPHPQLEERLRLCQPNQDLPAWWEPGRHDRDLLRGAAKHGVSRTDYHILNDPELGFLEAHRKFTQGRGAEPAPASNPLTPVPVVKEEEMKAENGDTVEANVETSEEVKGEVKEENCEKPEEKPKEEMKSEEEGKDSELKQEEPKEEKLDLEVQDEEKEKEGETKIEESNSTNETSKEEKDTDLEVLPLPVPASKETQLEEQEMPSGAAGDLKPSTDKASEEEEEEKMDEDDKSEKSSQAEGKFVLFF